MQRILIMGLPGSGKTTLAQYLVDALQNENKTVWHLNADEIRKEANDWDFSEEGRIRQSVRMRTLADSKDVDFVIADFVAPFPIMRDNFDAHWTIWVDTIDEGRFADTNKIFVKPTKFDFRVTVKDAAAWGEALGHEIAGNWRPKVFDWKKPTVQMLGRWQPWHAGHRALFDRLIAMTGQVVIQIRDCEGWNDSNPFALDTVIENIHKDLDQKYRGMFAVQVVPNIVHIGYGRGVGYTFGEESFEKEITDISGTQIRKDLGYK